MPTVDVADAVAEVHHAAEIGLHLISLPSGQSPGREDWNHPEWDPLWVAAEEAGMVIGIHIGTEAVTSGEVPWSRRRPADFVESTRDGPYTAMKLVACGVFDRCRT